MKVGSIVYIAGAGPVGLCAAAASFLLGAACVFIADSKADRLRLAEKIGCKTIDLSKSAAMTARCALQSTRRYPRALDFLSNECATHCAVAVALDV